LLGARGSPVGRFMLIDGSSCFVLTTFLFSLGFVLSSSASIVLAHVKRIEVVLLVTVTLIVFILHFVRKVGRRSLQRVSTGERNA
jgi:membrane protein DedA with SNARE-associated domain